MAAFRIGLLSFTVLLGLIVLSALIGLAMSVCGLGGMWLVTGSPDIVLSKLKTETCSIYSSYSRSIIPIILLMGHLAGLGGMSRTLFNATEAWPGYRKGGTAIAAVGACAGFGAVWPVVLIFIAVVGGIYTGIFNPKEGASVGALGTSLLASSSGSLEMARMKAALLATASGTAMIFFIVLVAAFFNAFLAPTQVPQTRGYAPWTVIVIILLIYLELGCVVDSLSMILLTVPIFVPVIQSLDFGLGPEETAIWFVILVLVVVEVGLITPPVGLNLFAINAMDREAPIRETYFAVMFFIASDVLRVALLTAFPAITLFLLH